MALNADGEISEVNAEDVEGFVSATGDFFAFKRQSPVEYGASSMFFENVYGLKLPATTPTIEGRTYKMFMLAGGTNQNDGNYMGQDSVTTMAFGPSSTIEFTSSTAATVNAKLQIREKATWDGATNYIINPLTDKAAGAITPAVMSDVGKATITIGGITDKTLMGGFDGESVEFPLSGNIYELVLDGHFGEDGNVGIFEVKYSLEGDTTQQAGIAFLVDVTIE